MYLCDQRFGEGAGVEGTVSKEGQKAVKPRDYKGSIFGSVSKWSQESDMVLPWILSGALHDVTTVPFPIDPAL